MTNEFKYGVVIVTFNRLLLLKECVECVLSQSLPFSEVVIVNNCSTDGTIEFLNELCECNGTNPKLVVINMEKNIGGAGGFHIGLKTIMNDVDATLIIDDDAMLNEHFLEEIHRHRSSSISAYSGTVITDDAIDTTHRRRVKNKTFMTKKDVSAYEYENETFEYDMATFCGLCIDNKMIEQVGLPREDFFIWYDDTEYSLRIRRYSKILNVCSAIITHKTIRDSSNRLSWKSYYGYRNQLIMGMEYSRHPELFKMYRVLFHAFKELNAYLQSVLPKEKAQKAYFKNCVGLYKDSLADGLFQVTGISKKYPPGRRIG